MFVNRRTFIAKRGKMDEAIAFVKEGMDWPHAARVYASDLGLFDTFAVEFEFENLAEYERLMKEAMATATPEWWEKWFSLTENGGTNEIWRLA